ncbi:MAG: hypothetical protein AAF558_10265 [Verrucomicrobiota bacterium]
MQLFAYSRAYALAGLALVWITSNQAAANLLTNGSFETEPATSQGGQGYYTQSITSSATTFTINGWTFGRLNGNNNGNPRFHWFSSTNRPGWTNLPQDGNWALQLNSDNRNSRLFVEQTVAVTAGLEYELSFYFIDESAFSGADIGVTATISGAPVTTINTDFTTSLNDTWVNETIRFTANSSGDVTLRFTDLIPSSNVQQNVILDNFSLTVVPEADTILSLIALGAVFAFFQVRRYFRKPAARIQ